MNCVFDWCISNLFPGIVATALTALYLFVYNKIQNRKKFSKAKGKYHGDGTGSEASIEYKGGNKLRIKLTHDGRKRTWEGLITMDNEHYGSLGFKYTDRQNEFGFKRCIITDDGKKMLLINVAPPEQGGEVKYGREVLIKEE